MNSIKQLRFQLPEDSKMLKSNFIYGAATASFQIEGSTNKDGKLNSIWDKFCNTPGKVLNGDTGHPACDHYNLWESDLKMIKDINFDAYRFSISWPRVMTRDNKLNHKGLDFYKKLTDKLLELGIKPFITLYHWDLPQYIEDRGGWLSRETAYLFRDYADAVTKELGDKAYSFTTLNEPWCSAFLGYGNGIHAPGLNSQKFAKQAGHHLLLAHGLGMEVLRTNAAKAMNGIVLNMAPMYPKSDRYDDLVVSKLADAGGNHWFLEPLIEGRYPEIINRFKPDESPLVLERDMEIIKAPLDFIGINYYTRLLASFNQESLMDIHVKDGVEYTDIGWEVYPQGLTDILVDINKQYKLPKIFITENGAACADKVEAGEVIDQQRCQYYNSHLNAVHNAIEQGVNVEGYFAWSLMDNFEWAEGYSKRFGMVHVDFESQKRTVKESAKAFNILLKSRVASD